MNYQNRPISAVILAAFVVLYLAGCSSNKTSLLQGTRERISHDGEIVTRPTISVTAVRAVSEKETVGVDPTPFWGRTAVSNTHSLGLMLRVPFRKQAEWMVFGTLSGGVQDTYRNESGTKINRFFPFRVGAALYEPIWKSSDGKCSIGSLGQISFTTLYLFPVDDQETQNLFDESPRRNTVSEFSGAFIFRQEVLPGVAVVVSPEAGFSALSMYNAGYSAGVSFKILNRSLLLRYTNPYLFSTSESWFISSDHSLPRPAYFSITF